MSMPGKPLLSVIVSTLNAEAHLGACLESIYAQSCPLWEIIVIDGGSRDGTVDIIRRNAPRLKHWTSENDKGVYDAWNKALPHIDGRWVMFLGADDQLWDAGVLEAVTPVLTDPGTDSRILYGRVALTDEVGRLLRFEGRPWPQIAQRFEREMCIPHQGVFHRADIFSQKSFDDSFRYAGDYALLLGEVLNRPPLFIDRCVSTWRQGGLTSRPGLSIKVLKEFRVARAKNGHPGRHPYWTECKAWGKYTMEKLFGTKPAAKLLSTYRKLSG